MVLQGLTNVWRRHDTRRHAILDRDSYLWPIESYRLHSRTGNGLLLQGANNICGIDRDGVFKRCQAAGGCLWSYVGPYERYIREIDIPEEE